MERMLGNERLRGVSDVGAFSDIAHQDGDSGPVDLVAEGHCFFIRFHSRFRS